MTAGAVIGCATPSTASNVPATPFAVANTYVPVAGSSEMFPVRRIYSGTPENVGPTVKGDVIECHIDGLPELSIKII